MPRLVKPHNFLLKIVFSIFEVSYFCHTQLLRFRSYVIFKHWKTLKKVIFVITNSIL